MVDDTAGRRKRKLTYIASVLVGLFSLAGVVTFAVLHPPSPKPARIEPEPAKKAPEAKPKVAVTSPAVLGKAELLAVVRDAASIFAARGELGSHTKMLQRRFSVRIAFGCYEDGNNAGQTSLTFNPDYKSASLSATPADWTTSLVIQGFPWKDGIEAVEGFWLPRAWTDSEACPPQINYIQPIFPTAPAAQTIGLAQLFPVDAARQARHSAKPYFFSRKLPAGEPELRNRSYFLLLEGRITGFPDGNDLHCWMEGAAHRPVCLFGVEFDNVAFEDAETGKALASWRS
jgi:hypothetical protein